MLSVITLQVFVDNATAHSRERLIDVNLDTPIEDRRLNPRILTNTT
jgi:hypothetical protein